MTGSDATDLENAPAEAPLPPQPSPPATEAQPPSELDTLRGEVEALRDKNLRLLAETRNLQQRAQREKAEALKYAEAEFARDLLTVLDDLERTRRAAQEGAAPSAVADGVRIVYEHLLKVFKARGIEPIDALGQPFNPHLHEALLQQPSAEHPAGTVLEEVARGYRMHERVLRPARVVVSSGPPPAATTEEQKAKE